MAVHRVGRHVPGSANKRDIHLAMMVYDCGILQMAKRGEDGAAVNPLLAQTVPAAPPDDALRFFAPGQAHVSHAYEYDLERDRDDGWFIRGYAGRDEAYRLVPDEIAGKRIVGVGSSAYEGFSNLEKLCILWDIKGGVLYGEHGSAAYQYAIDHGIPFAEADFGPDCPYGRPAG